MSKRGNGASGHFWLWTGEAEYEGQLLSTTENQLTARVRSAGRWSPATGSPGTQIPRDLRERQRWFARRVGFAQSPEILSGALLEIRVSAVQPCRNAQFEYVLAGTFSRVEDDHLEALSRLSSDEAMNYLQSHSSRPNIAGRLGIG